MRKALLLFLLAASICSYPFYAKAETSIKLEPSDTEEQVIGKAVLVTPSRVQVEWQRIEFGAFLHFGMNTFTNKEWGDGTENPKLFNPVKFDARQWMKALKAAGIRQVIITAKHHDGFCLWPSKYTEHSVKNSPWKDGKGDVVREVSDAAREAGLKFGFYLSPWDRHEKTFGTPAYNEYYMNQLRELLTNYGDISEVWMDGACGEMDPRCKDLKYDWPNIFALIRELQPNAAMSIYGPDVRWVGNEGGRTRPSEWSVVPETISHRDDDLGSRGKLMEAAKRGEAIRWYPAQVDTSIRRGWFYHKSEDYLVRDMRVLLDIYFNSVGGNNELLLNVPPDNRGLITEFDAKVLRKLGTYLSKTFERNLAAGASATAEACGNSSDAAQTLDGSDESAWAAPDKCIETAFEYKLPSPALFDVVMIQEHIISGQKIESFAVDVWESGGWKEIATATTIGYKKLLRIKPVQSERVRVRITGARSAPAISEFGLFATPDALK